MDTWIQPIQSIIDFNTNRGIGMNANRMTWKLWVEYKTSAFAVNNRLREINIK